MDLSCDCRDLEPDIRYHPECREWFDNVALRPSSHSVDLREAFYSCQKVSEGRQVLDTVAETPDSPRSTASRSSSLMSNPLTRADLTNGRIAINLVTSSNDAAALNHGLPAQIEHDDRCESA